MYLSNLALIGNSTMSNPYKIIRINKVELAGKNSRDNHSSLNYFRELLDIPNEEVKYQIQMIIICS